MKYNNVFFASHPGDSSHRVYMFELPSLDIRINTGDQLRVLCKAGHLLNEEKTVVATGPNMILERGHAKQVATAMGGYYPLAKAVGKVEQKQVESICYFKATVPNAASERHDAEGPLSDDCIF